MCRHTVGLAVLLNTVLYGCAPEKEEPVDHESIAPVTKSAYAVCIGVESVSSTGYPKRPPDLSTTVADAKMMRDMFEARGFQTRLLVSDKHTRDASVKSVLDEIGRAADALNRMNSGGYFVIYFSGHGAFVPDVNKDEASLHSTDQFDETWCLWDKQLVDDQIFEALNKFKPEVRVVLLSDSCHSGTVIKFIGNDLLAIARRELTADQTLERTAAVKLILGPQISDREPGTRTLTAEEMAAAYDVNKADYDDVQGANHKRDVRGGLTLAITACRDEETANSKDGFGIFTGSLVKVFDHGKFEGDFNSFYIAVRDKASSVRKAQTAQIYPIDTVESLLAKETPFDLTNSSGPLRE